jgi:hypothetical protein
MRHKRLIAAIAFAGGLTAAALAYAQSYPPPIVPLIHSTTDLIPISPNGAPTAQGWQVAPAQVSNAPQYVKVGVVNGSGAIASNGYSSYFAQAQTYLIIVLTATMPYSYATAALAPSDGARECVTASGGAISLLYFQPSAGQTVTGGSAIVLAANVSACFTYSLANLTWDRS